MAGPGTAALGAEAALVAAGAATVGYFTYAAGIALAADGTLAHTGHWEGFATAFEVRPDRRTVMAATCNVPHLSPNVLTAKLREIWT